MNNLNITNKASKVSWIPRLQTRSDASWQIISESELEQCNYDVKLLQFNNLPDMFCRTAQFTHGHIDCTKRKELL